MTGTYGWVDRSADPDDAADWQDRINRWPAIRSYKRRSYEHLSECALVVDVGAGTGGDLAHHASAIAVDRSSTMSRRASARGIAVVGEAERLPLRGAAADGVRADRVVQHLAEPVRGLREMVRVLSPGGTLVVCDPDQTTLTIDVPWARAELVEQVRVRRRDVQYRNGTFARRLPEVLDALGLQVVGVEAFPLTLADPDDAFGIARWVRHRFEAGDGATRDDVVEWDNAMARAKTEPGFAYCVTYFVVMCRKPG